MTMKHILNHYGIGGDNMTPKEFEEKYGVANESLVFVEPKVFSGKEIKEDVLSIDLESCEFSYTDKDGFHHLGQVEFSKLAIKTFRGIFVSDAPNALKDNVMYKLHLKTIDLLTPEAVTTDIPDTVEERLLDVANELGMENVLCILAEECSELSQAALKYRRAELNMTPKSKEEAFDNLVEEIADVESCILQIKLLFPNMNVDKKAGIIKEQKSKRFWRRTFIDKNADS